MKASALGVFFVLLLCSCYRPPQPQQRECPSAAISLAMPTSSALAECEEQKDRCLTMWSAESASCAPLKLAAARASASATTGEAPVPWPVVETDDLDKMIGIWVDASTGDALDHGKLRLGGVRVELQKAKGKTPYKLTFWAPKPGHEDGRTVSGGCGLYNELHDLREQGNDAWRTAFCRGYGIAETIGVKTKVSMRSNADSKKLRLRVGDLLDTTLVRQ